MSVLQSLKDATSAKEKEWRELLELSIEKLEGELERSKKSLEEEQTKFLELKTDFKHNFAILQEKENNCTTLKNELEKVRKENDNLAADYRDVSATNEKLRCQLDQEREAIEDIRNFFKDSLDRQTKEHERTKKEIENYYTEEIDNLQKSKTTLLKDLALCEEKFNSDREHYITEHEAKYYELKTTYDEERNSQEQKIFTLALEKDMLLKDMQTLTAAANSLQKELDVKDAAFNELRTRNSSLEIKVRDMEKVHQALEKQTKYDISEKADLYSKHIRDYEQKNSDLKTSLTEFEKKCSELKNEVSSLKQQLQDQNRSHASELQTKDEELSRLRSRSEFDIMQKESSYEKLFDEKRKLQQELELCTIEKDRLSKMLAEEGKHCKEKLDRMKYDLNVKNEDLERYRGEIAINLENIRAVQQEMEQKDIDWNRKCEAIEAASYEKSETLVKTLTEHRSKLSVELSELKRSLNAKTHLVALLKKERDCSVLTLQRHNLSVDFDIPIKDSQIDSEGLRSVEFERMADQNGNLREVIKKMKDEMENFSRESDSKHKQEVKRLSEIISNLQNEIVVKSDKLNEIQSRNKDFELELHKLKRAIESQPENGTPNVESEKYSEMQYDLMSLKRKSESEIRHLRAQLTASEEKVWLVTRERDDYAQRLRASPISGQSFHPNQQISSREAQFIVELNTKLKTAAKQINYLAKERQRLIALCNKLKAGTLETQNPHISPHAETSAQKSRLDEIQRLQYELARKQLAENTEAEENSAKKVVSIRDKSNERPKRIRSPISSSSRTSSPIDRNPIIGRPADPSEAFSQENVQKRDLNPLMDDRPGIEQPPVDVMSSIGGEDSTLQNIMRMVDKGPESFTPMMSLNSSEGAALSGKPIDPQSSYGNPIDSERAKEPSKGYAVESGDLEIVGRSESIAAEKDRKQVALSLKAQGKLAPAETRRRVVRNYNNKSDK